MKRSDNPVNRPENTKKEEKKSEVKAPSKNNVHKER